MSPQLCPGFRKWLRQPQRRSWPLEVGGGLSYFGTHAANSNPHIDYTAFDGNLLGPSLWADWTFRHIPKSLYGLGIELETRDLDWANSGPDPRLSEFTGEGGVIAKWHRYHNFHPYAKALAGFGSIDFNNGYPGIRNGDHDTRTFYCPGAGAEFRIKNNLWIRGDYEYQFWTDFGRATLEPQGMTIGVTYDMRNFHFSRGQAGY